MKNKELLIEDGWCCIETDENGLEIWSKGVLNIHYHPDTDKCGKVWSSEE